MDISERIKELRKKTGLSQSKFSSKFGIPVRTLQQWEQGISAPPDYVVRMMGYIMLLEENGQINGGELMGGKREDGK
ncbi:helix-turn-helix domain-containing protein [Butyrivibrio sp. VCB2001]|uniref:helix-turn-helix domain-containing protein n=1 Tax=Butyrivibrio sp. VCB2001 TaxID=1280667 RepID=UPI0004201664|nr:helix-turn-helix domain-containing protein [Butyrivibrio sp. VCB2001]